jgi:hypothetical protein
MQRHMALAEYELMLQAFSAVEAGLPLAETDALRRPLCDELRRLAEQAKTVRDFEKIEMKITGVAIMEGRDPVIVINNKSLSIGDMVNDELYIRSIEPGEVEFIFRGVILARLF